MAGALLGDVKGGAARVLRHCMAGSSAAGAAGTPRWRAYAAHSLCEDKRMLFTDRQLRKLIFPLVIEQILNVAMGMADTIMVASCGEAAVSGISLVDSFSILLIGLFGAMAAGGSVVVAQFIGRGDKGQVAEASNQLFLSVTALSVALMLFSVALNRQIISVVFGSLEPDVMESAMIYLYISAISYPFLAFYNSAAALFRSVGNSKISMYISLAANLLNIGGNALLIFGFGLGVLGAALSTLASRVVAAAIIAVLLVRRSELPVRWGLRWNKRMIQKILYIGVPNGLENSIFQLGKLLLSGLTATFGTVAIAANAVASTVCALETIPANAIGIAMITVVGQCVGAREYDQGRKYIGKLMKTTYIYLVALNITIIALLGPICSMYNLSPQTAGLARWLMMIHSIFCVVLHPTSFCMANGLRAANDVRFTMFVAIASMWICRIVMAYILARGFGLGLKGIWIAMILDWFVRSCFFLWRILSGRWLRYAGRNA